VDGSAPSSRVAPLPAAVDGPAIELGWALEGPGEAVDVAGFTIQVAIDGGSYTPFLARTTAASAIYPGEPGRTYAFYSQASFRRGDANPDGSVNITDAIFILGYQFLGQRAPACLDAADADDDGRLNITDPIFLLNALFAGGPPVPAPRINACGLDPTPDALPPCIAAQAGCP
jgi:hypothetical protein